MTRITNSAKRMERLIGDLLDLTRVRLGGTLPFAPRRTDLQKVCEEAVLETGAAHPEINLHLVVRGDVVGQWDADRLAQVVSNLVQNAIRYGNGTPITLVAEDDGDAVTLAVHNGGPPIPPGAELSIFEPLARGPAADGAHNIGLGLFIARTIVIMHGGDISVSSSREDGTTFTARLPKAQPVNAAFHASAAP